ncbi:MAG: methionine--tRNA ligase [Alphaproteobacteria bacterium]|nr:methionine--tRNA ligase [Alphaproteobacteria bacterium]
MKKNYYVTCAIPYANGEPHIGHAYEVIIGDVLARFKRLDGYNVRFQTGMDEHGQKNEREAAKRGVSPQELVNRISAQFKDLYERLGISFDDFIRTTEPRHIKRAQDFWRRLQENGDIYLGKYSGWYSVRDEAYFDEGELTTSPAGQKLAPSGAPVEWMEEESYFFSLSKYQDRLLALYDSTPSFIQPRSRFNEVYNFVKSGLRDLSVSRTTFKWGVPVPDAPEHVMYVWVDALSNYITALEYPDESEGSLMKAFWPADVHIIGKDILRFHAIYWPAFLMATGLPLPKVIAGHGHILNHGEKMSKSVGNVIAPNDAVAKFGLDQIRYFLLRDFSYMHDGDMWDEKVAERINSDLANDLGNLAQRSLSMIAKNCEGKVPQAGAFTDSDKALLAKAYGLAAQMWQEIDVFAFHKALEHVWAVIADGNRYVDEQAPWALRKTDSQRMATVLYVLAEALRCIAILLQPVMPESMDKMLAQLSVPKDKRDFACLSEKDALVAGTILPAPSGIFPRYMPKEEK